MLPIDFNRSEITDMVILVRNFWCSFKVQRPPETEGLHEIQPTIYSLPVSQCFNNITR